MNNGKLICDFSTAASEKFNFRIFILIHFEQAGIK